MTLNVSRGHQLNFSSSGSTVSLVRSIVRRVASRTGLQGWASLRITMCLSDARALHPHVVVGKYWMKHMVSLMETSEERWEVWVWVSSVMSCVFV